MAKPKLALIPSAQGSKFYSVLPSSGVGDFDFTRSGSATRINSQGLIETVANGVSRLNYPMIDGVVKGCPSHLLEPQRTNLLTYSEDFSVYVKNNVTVTSNSTISPKGDLTADLITEDLTLNTHRVYLGSGVNVVSSSSYSVSFFAKNNGANNITVIAENFGELPINTTFDLVNGVILSSISSSTIEKIGDYYYCTITATSSTTRNQAIIFYINRLNVASPFSYQGNGTSGIYIWGAQFEQGSYPTSYIPTNGTAITRAAETANGSGNAATFNDSEGVLMAEISAENETSSSARRISILNTTSNRILIGAESASSTIRTVITVGGSSKFDVSSSQLVTTNNKIAVKYSSNGSEMYINGFTVGISAIDSSFPSSTLNDLQFGSGNGNSPFYGKTRQIQYFDSALTDAQLETLTSWTSLQEMITSQLYTNY